MRKRLSQEVFDRYDVAARSATKDFMESIGWDCWDHPDKYAQDLVAKKDDTKVLVECEVKTLWSGDTFPFSTVQLPERKRKFFSDRTVFFIWNKEITNAIYFWSKSIEHLEPVVVQNKYVRDGEYFYQIPINLTKTTNKLEGS